MIISRIVGDLSHFQFVNVRSEPVDEKPVVRNDHHTALKSDEVLFEPLQGRQIEMVGRFI